MPVELSDAARALLSAPNIAHLATVAHDGTPRSHAVWVGMEGPNVVVCTARHTAKSRNAERQPHVALSVVGRDNPYDTLMVRGTVVEQRNDDDLGLMDQLAQAYTGEPFPFRDARGRVALLIEPTWFEHRTLPFHEAPAT
ncbi:MAG: TIGR03618 family F420-dependent PPOX class oxidoreductase [Acidimicrobiales bacterium]